MNSARQKLHQRPHKTVSTPKTYWIIRCVWPKRATSASRLTFWKLYYLYCIKDFTTVFSGRKVCSYSYSTNKYVYCEGPRITHLYVFSINELHIWLNSDSLDIMNVIYKNSNIKIVVAVGRPNRDRDVAVRGYRDRASGFEKTIHYICLNYSLNDFSTKS